MKIVKVLMYIAIGFFLGSAGVYAAEDWQFFAITLSVMAIDLLSHQIARREEFLQ